MSKKVSSKSKDVLVNKWHFDTNHIATGYLCDCGPKSRDIYIAPKSRNPYTNRRGRAK